MSVFMTHNVNVIADYYTLKIFARKLFQSKRRTYNWNKPLFIYVYFKKQSEFSLTQPTSAMTYQTPNRRPLHNTFTIYEGVREQNREVEGLMQ